MENFKKLGISEPILKVIQEQKFENPTEIQKGSIPLIIQGKDVIGGSATGSGKTLAFGAGIIQRAEKGQGIQALILEPTRELAEQVAQEFAKYSKHKGLKVVVVYGGVSINPQLEDLHTADIVIATPGRLLDHMQRCSIDLHKVYTLVLDEADVMLDMGFIDDVEKIMKGCPQRNQTLMFTATVTPELEHITAKYMRDPQKVSVESYVDPTKLKQVYYNVESQQKYALLVSLLKQEKGGLVMVFCNSRVNVDFVANNLRAEGLRAQAIHGGFSQDKRSRTMDKFHASSTSVLVCTDVAARGLHIDGVTHVYNYDIPKESKQYIHRIGRTARAGKEGKAINILCQMDHDNFSHVLQDFAVDIEKIPTPNIPRVRISWKPAPRGGFGGRGGFRGNDRGGDRGGFNRGGPRHSSHSGPRHGGARPSHGPKRHSGPRPNHSAPRQTSHKTSGSGPVIIDGQYVGA
ncbi:DEAD/DEAH box helicase [Thermoproteota archaeon]